MHITCPTCAAEYEVPDALAAGRVVRCVRCTTQWALSPTPVPEFLPVADPHPPVPEPILETAAAEPPEPEIPPVLEPRPVEPMAPLAGPPSRHGHHSGAIPLAAAWIGSGALLAGLITAAVVWREPVMGAWPPSQRLYAALGYTEPGSLHVDRDVVK